MVEAAETIRRPVWEGVQRVAALWFTRAWPDEAARIAHLVAAWTPGSRALRFPQGDLLYFAAPSWRRCDDCIGQPLCRAGSRLVTSAPLTREELHGIDGADVGIVEGAQLTPLWLANATVLDLSVHIDLDGHALHDTFDCREAQPPPAHESLAGKDVRDVIGDKVPAQSKESKALRRALVDRDTGKPVSSGAAPGAQPPRTWLDTVRGWLLPAAAAAATQIPARRETAAPPRWREIAGRIAMFTRLAQLIGRQHAEHLRRLLQLFDDGNIDEALRHAIPLGDEQSGPLGMAFGRLKRRDDLTLSSGRSAGTGIAVGDSLMDHLQSRYRRTFEKLDRAGRVDEAVFVLAELLGARQEALDYLVKHGRSAQAAELALGWDMSAATIIRLLMLAGDIGRAVLVARRDNAFLSAITELEPKHADIAAALRREWGVALAARGEWLQAFDVVWPVSDARALAIEWLVTAEAAGMQLSGRALVRRAQLLPDTLDVHAERIRSLLDPEAAPAAREAMALALADDKPLTPAVRMLARAVLPMAAADRAADANALHQAQLEYLVRIANDAALKADLPKWRVSRNPENRNVYSRTEAQTLVMPAPPPAGLHAIVDVAALADGRWMVALGETGVAVVDASGRLTQRYAVPADRLVIGESGLVALAVAERGTMQQITRLDLVRRTAMDLGVMPLRHYARTFDGLAWTVVSEGRIQVIDTTSSARDLLWQVADLPGEVVATVFDERHQTFLFERGEAYESWCYEWPNRRLAARRDVVPASPDGNDRSLLMRDGRLVHARVETGPAGMATLVYDWGGNHQRTLLRSTGTDEQFVAVFRCFDQGLLVALHTGRDSRYTLVSAPYGVPAAELAWPGGAPVRVRAQGRHLLWFDDHGRLLDLDTHTSQTRSVSIG